MGLWAFNKTIFKSYIQFINYTIRTFINYIIRTFINYTIKTFINYTIRMFINYPIKTFILSDLFLFCELSFQGCEPCSCIDK